MPLLNAIRIFAKKEKVFVIATLAAIISSIFVPPDSVYIKYIDAHVILVLFSLMLVVAALRSCGLFDACADFLCSKVKTQRALCMVLVALCFSFSMFITNDVALLTFVPFAVLLLSKSGGTKFLAVTVVLQTIAANLGSMCMPTGNPQNIFLFSKMNASVGKFFSLLLPYSAVAFLLLFVCCFLVPSTPLKIQAAYQKKRIDKIRSLLYTGLFVLCLLGVVKIIPFWCAAAISLFAVLATQKSLFAKVDYVLLLTFCSFFVFTGNIERIEIVRKFLEKTVCGREFFSGLAASQIISNVPAALLLYPFSANPSNLLLGVNVGGLGTLVASLASLISYKLYIKAAASMPLPLTNSSKAFQETSMPMTTANPSQFTGTPSSPAKYLLLFTGLNLFFMAILCAIYLFSK